MGRAATRIAVVPADAGPAFAHFLDIPYWLHGGNPHWVPPLRMQQKEVLDRARNPFFRHARMRLFVAYRDGRPAGRIAAINDDVHNRTHHETTTQWGFFECADDGEIAAALFAAIEAAATDWGHTLLRGPFNPSVNEEIGLQIDAFERPSFIMIPGNPPYYQRLVQAAGYTKSVDLFCYWIDSGMVSQRFTREAEAIIHRSGATYRKLDRTRLEAEADGIWEIYNSAWEDNWLWVRITREEFRRMVDNLKQIADFDMVFVAEDASGKMVGVSVAVPNVNEALIHLRDGRLLPLGWLQLLWRSRPGAIKGLRFLIMGVLAPWRGKGIDVALNYHQFLEATRKGYTHGEMSQILETNTPMVHAAEALGGVRYKTHRMYEKPVRKTGAAAGRGIEMGGSGAA
ncbi:MAG: N-acetyltransferase [Devosia nanyangense]|uniref:N-acetyltransferase n=1 Tax=Devosia nanyangense TaxID=1228055 RepID=A0A933KZX2_9HYPH|nr:N-acetyltransferase [Devosia nanyangense]